MHKKAAAGSWRLASRAKRTSHRQRSVCCCAGGSPLRDAQAKLAPPPPAAAFSTHSSFGAAMPRRHGPVRRYDGSSQMRSNDPCPTSMQRASCVRDVPHNAMACGRTRATGLSSSVVFSPRYPATLEALGLTMPQSNISIWNGAHSSATRRPARERERRCVRYSGLRPL